MHDPAAAAMLLQTEVQKRAAAPDAASSCSNLPGSVRARTLCAIAGTSTGAAVIRNTACHVGAPLGAAAGACSSRRSRRAAPARAGGPARALSGLEGRRPQKRRSAPGRRAEAGAPCCVAGASRVCGLRGAALFLLAWPWLAAKTGNLQRRWRADRAPATATQLTPAHAQLRVGARSKGAPRASRRMPGGGAHQPAARVAGPGASH